MNKSKKMLRFLLSLALLVTSLPPFANAEQYCTISDIQEQAAEGWQGSYSYNGAEIQVDIPINVPDVDAVPAVGIVGPTGLNPVIPQGGKLSFNDETGFAFSVSQKDRSKPAPGDREVYVEPDARAENSPYSQDEAIAFMMKVLQESGAVLDQSDLYLQSIVPYSRYYEAGEREGGAPVLNYDNPKSEQGAYYITYRQKFHGIPYLTNEMPYRTPPRVNYSTFTPFGNTILILEHEQEYAFIFTPAIEDGVLAADLPLAPMEKVIAEFEKHINTGYIRRVDELSFGYAAFRNPDDPEYSWVLLPVWLLRGGIVVNPKDPDPQPAEGSLEYTRKFSGQYAFVNAQTGEYLEPEDDSATRDVAKFITW